MGETTRRQVQADAWRQAMTALNIGWDLALPIFGGVLLGHHLDRRWGRGYAFTLGLLVLGLVIGGYSVARTLQRELRRGQLDLTALTHVRTQDRLRELEEENADRPSRHA